MQRRFKKRTTFVARSDDGEEVTVFEDTHFIEVTDTGGTQTMESGQSFHTPDGEIVNEVSKQEGIYQVLRPRNPLPLIVKRIDVQPVSDQT